MPPRQPDPLPVFFTRHPLVIGVERRSFNVTVEVLDISSHRLDPFLARQRGREADQGGPHPPHHLNRTRAEVPDLVEREGQVVLPRRGRDDQPESPVLVNDVAGVQFGRAETAQEILELIDGLDRRRRVVDRRR